MINYKTGNLIDLAEAGDFHIIVHGCNCFNTFGSGLAKEIKTRYPKAYAADCSTAKGNANKLGRFSVMIGRQFNIVNAYTQFDFGHDGKDRFEYYHFDSILAALNHKYPGANYGFPKIGAGLAGGDWSRIEQQLLGFSEAIDGTVTVCTL